MFALACIGLLLFSIAFFQYGAARYDSGMTNFQIVRYIWDCATEPFVNWGNWLRGFATGAYKLVLKNDAPKPITETNEYASSGESAFEIVAMVSSALGMVLGGLGLLLAIGNEIYRVFNKCG